MSIRTELVVILLLTACALVLGHQLFALGGSDLGQIATTISAAGGVLIGVIFAWWYLEVRLLSPLKHVSNRALRRAGGEDPSDSERPFAAAPRELNGISDAMDALRIRLERHLSSEEIAQSALRDQESRLAAVFNAAADGILTADARWRVESANWAALRLFGYTRQELLDKPLAALFKCGADTAPETLLNLQDKFEQAQVIGATTDAEGVRRDGTAFPALVTSSAIVHDEERLYVLTIRDLSELRQLRVEMEEARRLATIGEMGASIAHEIRNPLAGISGALQILRTRHVNGGEVADIMDDAMGNIGRVEQTIQRLLLFAREWNVRREPVRVADVLRCAIRDSSTDESFENVEVRVEVPDDLAAELDPVLAQHALANVLTNAAQAMMDGGVITCEIVPTEQWIHILISDSGPGLGSEELDCAMRPLYTTKRQGTGLGLSITRHIMEAHGGSIELRNGHGRGTCACLRFPAVPDTWEVDPVTNSGTSQAVTTGQGKN